MFHFELDQTLYHNAIALTVILQWR